ncbi:Protein of unknown function [Micromonospora phaseoli]|uniref:DUF3263 domain-containing protein n=1 Tax=Micromonospora phaseoli TaxID=1144548 RepID=A0A1H7DHQ7_9ACTN|nr:DUF3263 domain-containing protein [Micromonospora phaseoli]PZW02345.1 uncharacterized protein DUF3263 [Micromonospora phaseoli]GIJ75653.1 hypothetical protein Xph01_00850 [Micromonospora phaseoli]SEK01361.1 Protein of unknown function [Micromonospora phaseoli]
MQPADATPAAQTGPDAVTVPPPRSAPEVESDPAYGDTAPQERAAEEAAPEETSSGDHVRPAGVATPGGLGERERAILAFERQWWRHAGAKEQAIRDRFGLSATRYYQVLNTLLDNPAALAADPVLVGRLIRLRASRARNRRR